MNQHQAQQAVHRQAQQRMQAVPMARFMNGNIPRQPMVPNGVGSGQSQMQFPMTAPGQQPNGIPGSVGAPSVPGAPSQPPFQPVLPGQRPPPQQRVPNGMPPFQSPTMAHSPTGGASQHGQAAMSQLGPSPHLAHMNRGGMLPPGGMQGMNNQASIGGPQGNTPTQSFQQVGRPPSAPPTPGQNNMMTQPSPSQASRQIPGGMPPANDMRQVSDNMLINDLIRTNPALLASCKQEAGIGEKDYQAYTPEEKVNSLFVSEVAAI